MIAVLGIIHPARFESEAKGARLGDVLPISRYTNLRPPQPPIERFATVDLLILVTIRPDGAWWRVAVLERPSFVASTWTGRSNRTPIVYLSKIGFGRLDSSGGELPPRQLTAEEVRAIVGGDITALAPAPTVDEARAAELAKGLLEVSERAARLGLELPDLVRDLFALASNDKRTFEALNMVGIDLTVTAYDEVGLAKPDSGTRLLACFVGFATNGFGGVFGLVASGAGAPCVVEFIHEDEHFELVGNDVSDWLARELADAGEIRAHLQIGASEGDLRLTESLTALGIR